MSSKREAQLAEDAVAYNADQSEKPFKDREYVTPLGEICFKPFLDEMDDNDTYMVAVSFPKKSTFIKQLIAELKALKQDTFGKHARNIDPGLKDGDDYLESQLEDADTEKDEELVREKYGHLEGTYFMNFKTKYDLNENLEDAGIVDGKLKTVEADRIHSGSKVVVLFKLYDYDKKKRRGIGFGLQGMQVYELGDKKYGGRNVSRAFKERATGLPPRKKKGDKSSDEPDPKKRKKKKSAEEPTRKKKKAAPEAEPETTRKKKKKAAPEADTEPVTKKKKKKKKKAVSDLQGVWD